MRKHLVLIALLLALCAPSKMLFAADLANFELVPQSDFVDLVREAPLAYGNKRFDEAFSKYQRLACAGDKAAQAALAGMYLTGKGTERNDLLGYVWLKVASEYNFAAYRALVSKIEEALTPAQLAYTGARAEQLRSLYGIRPTNMSCTTSSSTSYSSNLKDAVVCFPESQPPNYLLHRCMAASN
jgi:hypothetical protein